MKRNRLIRPSNQTNIFSNKAKKLGKGRNLLVLSLLAIAGVSITSMVLATNKPVVNSTQSQLIDLPGLATENQAISNPTFQYNTTSTISVAKQDITSASATPDKLIKLSKPATDEIVDETLTPINAKQIANAAREAELAILEQQELQATSDKIEEQTVSTAEEAIDWQEITVKSGDNLSLIFPRVGLSARDVYNVAHLGKEVKPLLNLKPGQILRFDIKELQDSKSLQTLQLILSPIKTLTISATEEGLNINTINREYDSEQVVASGTIKSSLFGAGIDAGLSNNLVMQLAHIFGWDIDFALDLREGDHFKVIYTENYLDGEKVSDGVIQAAEFTNHGKTYQALRYTNSAGESDFYAPNGDSMRKAFSRTPVQFTRISSRFSLGRKHPVLNKIRAHKGVDYAAPSGTPIMATGDGKIKFIGRKGGYGRVIILSHAGKYSTLYGHMSKFRKGLKRGKRVKQGDIIGYVGMSGLATGPHLHYEFRINGVHRNPLTVKLPKADALAKKYRADFKKKSSSLLAQLDGINETSLALNSH